MERHTKTDPACTQHREPRTWWQRRRFNRMRGYGCLPCMIRRARIGRLRALGFSQGEAAALVAIELG